MAWFDGLAVDVQERIRGHNWQTALGRRTFEVVSRPKTIETLRQKLQRDRNTPLQNIQDVAGVRFEADMTLSEQDEVVRQIAHLFDHDPDESWVIRDLRSNPHSGYRAVHLWLRLPDGRVEVQVRTALQGAWANVFETAADVVGRDIRYGWMPDDPLFAELVRGLIDLSETSFALFEQRRDSITATEPQMLEAVMVWHTRALANLEELETMLSEMRARGV
jgi:hypothetical protein